MKFHTFWSIVQSMQDMQTQLLPAKFAATMSTLLLSVPSVPSPSLNKNAKRRQRKKEHKLELQSHVFGSYFPSSKLESDVSKSVSSDSVEIEYVAESLPVSVSSEFAAVFSKFARPEELTKKKEISAVVETVHAVAEEEALMDEEEGKEESNTVKRKKVRMEIAELKQKVAHPEVVEMHDGNSTDPLLLCFLKGYRNTIPVPKHWSQKRRYLANRRGWVKPPFQLPKFIADTGIAELRNNQAESDATQKSKQRARLQPKLHRLDIDYQVLHDAFFKFQTKPPMTLFGDVYHELKELDYKLRTKRPGQLSEELKKALGMSGPTIPPPWLLNMQRYGPPPAYPNMKIPGLNAPIPVGAKYGYQINEWGKPPVDELGRPIYGDPFGVYTEVEATEIMTTDLSKWGEFIPDEQFSDEEAETEVEEEEDEKLAPVPESKEVSEDEEEEVVEEKKSQVVQDESHDTSSHFELRKKIVNEDEPFQVRKELYTVIEQKDSRVGGSLFGSSHTYVIPSSKEKEEEVSRSNFVKNQLAASNDGSVQIALNPEELENLDATILKQKYVAQLEAEKAARSKQKEDYSDIYDEQNDKKKRKALGQKEEKSKKFKF